MAKYGYIGAVPTQSSSSNTGLFNMTDVFKLIEAGQWAQQTMDVNYLVVAGGGGARYYYGGGGGAGGLRSTVDNTGGGGSLESSLTLLPSTNYTVTVGAGGSNVTTTGSSSVFSTISTVGGARGSLSKWQRCCRWFRWRWSWNK